MQPCFTCHVSQCAHVLGEAAPTISQPGVQEGPSNALIVAHTHGHLFYIGPQAFTNLRYFIDKRNLCCQECIRRVLDHLCCIQVGNLNARAQRQIQCSHLARGLLV